MFQAKMADVIVIYAIAIIIVLMIKITIWLIYWLYYRPRRLRRMLEQQQVARQVLIIQQQQQPYLVSNYPTVQPFSYESVNPTLTTAPGLDGPPPPYENVVKTPPAEN